MRRLLGSRFVKSTSLLVGSTAISQVLGIAVLPLLTRLYSPEDFSVYAVFSAVLALITVVSCLRFEIAIPLPEERVEARSLIILSLLSSIFVAIVVLVIIVVWGKQIHLFTQGRLVGYLWILPVAGLLSGFYSTFQYWATRERDFMLLSKTRVAQALSGAGAQVGLGYIGITPFGLLMGQVLNVSAGALSLGRGCFRADRNAEIQVSRERLQATFKAYENFPKYSTFEALCNSAAIQLPLLLIAAYAIGPEVGFLMLAMRLLSAPMSLIGKSVAQVYLSEAPAYHQRSELKQFTLKVIWSLSKLGFLPALAAGVGAPFIVPFVFGADWERAGILIAWLTPCFFMQFLSAPVSMSLHITGNQKTALVLQVLGFFVRVGSVLLCGFYYERYLAEVYAISGLFFYAFYMLVIMKVLKSCER